MELVEGGKTTNGFESRVDGQKVVKPDRKFNQEQLKAIIESVQWQELRPNFPSEQALLPKDISLDQLDQLISAFDDINFSRREDFHVAKTFEQKAIEGFGDLTFLGSGELKYGYLLTTNKGKKMVVIVYPGYNLNLQVPEDERIYKACSAEGREKPCTLAYYSDFRTYLSIPVEINGEKIGLYLQEYGGKPMPGVYDRLIHEKKEAITDYSKARGYSIVDPDFGKPDHYFMVATNPETIGVIDIKLSDES
jgi:hypothetical protein